MLLVPFGGRLIPLAPIPAVLAAVTGIGDQAAWTPGPESRCLKAAAVILEDANIIFTARLQMWKRKLPSGSLP